MNSTWYTTHLTVSDFIIYILLNCILLDGSVAKIHTVQQNNYSPFNLKTNYKLIHVLLLQLKIINIPN